MKNALFALSLLGSVAAFPCMMLAQDKRAPLPDFTLTLTGDALIMAPVTPRENDPKFKGLLTAIRDADARYTNLEEIYPGPTAPAGPESAMWTDPAMLKELQWMGFNLFSAANNHTLDFGVQGVLDTMQALKDDSAVYAGMGRTLEEARRPAFLMTPHGRVAILHSVSSTPSYNTALDPRGDMSGRPGPNVLRFQTIYQVDAASFEALHALRQQLNPGSKPADGVTGTGSMQTMTFPGNGSGLNNIVPSLFQVGEKPGTVTKVNQDDLASAVHNVKDARSFADYVVVSIHAHESLPGDGHEPGGLPPEFLVQYAHAMIDAGADVFVATGPHMLRGIEIYKGKVILYSIGDLFFQHQLQTMPLAYYQRFHLAADALPVDVIAAEDAANPQDNPLLYQSVVARVAFHNGMPDRIVLTPIALTPKFPRGDGGAPQLADPALGAKILAGLQKASEPYGTKISIENGVGIIQIGGRTSSGM